MILFVDSNASTLTADDRQFPCVLGRGGANIDKHEGDGRTPIGRYPLRAVLIRPDRGLAPATALPWRWLRRDDGWSDDPRDPAYNRAVRHPHPFSAEHLWRDDGVYDIVVVIGHNDAPPVAGAGSAIFLHCTAPDRRPTEGCVAIARAALFALLPRLARGDAIDIA